MGSKRSWIIVWIMFYEFMSCSHDAKASQSYYTHDSLDSFLHDTAFKNISKPRTGQLYDVSLPYNLSGIEVSVVRLRTRSLWRNGANFSYFLIPPRILPRPFTKRVDLVYQNLGNWSSSYYNVPNHTFVAPVIGLLAYDSSNVSTGNGIIIELNATEDNPIIVRFPNISILDNGNMTVKCVRFYTNGTLELSNMTREGSCVARGQGHFAVVVPLSKEKRGKKVFKRWWVIGIVIGVVGLVLFLVLGIVAYKLIKRRRIRKMERETERSEVLDTTWVGRSRMPAASGIRTQPVLENSYVP